MSYCVCGHDPEDHKNEIGECDKPGCDCLGYEEDDDDFREDDDED